MHLPALMGHSARLFRMIWKSPQPADSLASNFFREKKYIGSKERRFISETVFAALRMKLLSEFCSLKALEICSLHIPEKKKDDEAVPSHEMLLIASTCIISIFYPSDDVIFSPEELIGNIIRSDDINFELLLAEALAINMDIEIEKAQEWISNVVASFHNLVKDSSGLLALKGKSKDQTDRSLLQYRYSMPYWIMDDWHRNYSKNNGWFEVCSLAESLLWGADVCLRVNLNMMEWEQAITLLAEEGIESRPGTLSPAAIILSKRVLLTQNKLFKAGIIEVQDEGSQLISYALNPEPGSVVLDACAGAGGKTLHLASIMNDNGSITASDIERMRLKEIYHRASRSGFSSINTILINPKDKRLPFKKEFDYVLVDAPCSGMGTTRRMPLPKWRLTPKLLSRHAEKQYMILSRYSACVKPGGVIVYSTCSLMPEENDLVINRFLIDNPDFIPDPLLNVFDKNGIHPNGLGPEDHSITLNPFLHGCDGFFIARLRKQ